MFEGRFLVNFIATSVATKEEQMDDRAVVTVEVFYAYTANSWVVGKYDKNDHQVGKSTEYVYSNREALDIGKSYKKENPDIKIRVFKRDGDLQRVI